MVWLSVIVDPVNVPKWSEPVDTPDNVTKWSTSRSACDSSAASTAVSNACIAALMVWLSLIVEPLNVPKWSDASETPDKVIRWSTSREALVGTSADASFVSTAVSNSWNAS